MSKKRLYVGNLPLDATAEAAAAGGKTNDEDKC